MHVNMDIVYLEAIKSIEVSWLNMIFFFNHIFCIKIIHFNTHGRKNNKILFNARNWFKCVLLVFNSMDWSAVFYHILISVLVTTSSTKSFTKFSTFWNFNITLITIFFFNLIYIFLQKLITLIFLTIFYRIFEAILC